MIKVINIISDTNIGGAGRCLLAYLDNYDKSVIDMEVFLPFDSLLKNELTARKINFTEVAHINDVSMNKAAISVLLRLFKAKEPDIVHTHAVMSGRMAAKLYGKCKTVHTRHSVFDQPDKLKKFPRKQVWGVTNSLLSDVIIAVSPAARDNIVEIGTDPKKIKIVFNGVNQVEYLTPKEKELVRQRYNLTKENFVISIIARLEEVKGHDYLLDAAKVILNKDQTIKFLIAGTGAMESHLKERVEKEEIKNVIFTGFIEKIMEIENITDLQLNCSYGTEATSLSLLEGMSLGIPAIVSDFGGNPYVIQKGVNGIVIPKKDSALLAKSILSLRNNREEYNRLVLSSRKTFQERFTSKKMAENITNIYKGLL